jgi:hypothetical protein
MAKTFRDIRKRAIFVRIVSCLCVLIYLITCLLIRQTRLFGGDIVGARPIWTIPDIWLGQSSMISTYSGYSLDIPCPNPVKVQSKKIFLSKSGFAHPEKQRPLQYDFS